LLFVGASVLIAGIEAARIAEEFLLIRVRSRRSGVDVKPPQYGHLPKMLARLQKSITLLLLLAAVSAAAILAHADHVVLAAAAALTISFGYAFFLAVEFGLLYRTRNRSPPSLQASASDLVRAWAVEAVTTPFVFFWRQPFLSRAVPDHWPTPSRAGRGVVLVHGLFCNRGFWNPWMDRLHSEGIPFIAVNLEPLFGSIDDYRASIEVAVSSMEEATGMPVVLVGHSMGGLAIRGWLAAHAADDRVHRLITIGTPHRGTWLARHSHGRNGKQMRMESPWLGRLNALDSPARRARITCFYSDCDNIVFPAECATLDGASNLLVRGAGHVRLAFESRIFDEVRRWLVSPIGASAGTNHEDLADQANRSEPSR
jgi:triacylglycerol lipase